MFELFAITSHKIVNFSPKAKHFSLLVRLVLVLIGFLITVQSAWAQIPTPTDTTTLATDSLKNPADTLKKAPPKGDIETTINYSARDSINTSVDGQIVWLYGAAKIVYGSIELEAEEIIIDYANNTLTAHGTRDSVGRRVGYPIFKNGSELYETKDIVYNFKTGRARISEVVTQQGEGYLHGDAVFKNEKNELLSLRNSYTTCNLEHPHFRIRSTKTKAIPDDKIVSGPFYMEFNDVPLYPMGFLFGMFPAQRESKSGIIFPSYGEERIRGFNLRSGGYFFDISDYIKLALTGDIYSKGGHALYAQSNYIKRYKYNGSFNFSYSKNKTNTQIENPTVFNDFRVTWSHTPQTKGTGRFSASVNAATSTYNQNNNLIYGYTNTINSTSLNNTSRKLSSNVSYNKRFAGTPFSMGLNLSHNQDLETKQLDLPLPNLTVNMQNQYPFQRKDGRETLLDNFSIGYSMAGTNRITNNLGRLSPDAVQDSIAPFNLDNLSTFFQNGKKGIRHSIPLGYSFKAFKYFTVSPSVSYEEKWYFEQLNWEYDIVNNRPTLVVKDTTRGFNRIANYSFSTSFNTRIYGTKLFRPGNKVQAIRHVMNPTISFSYTPDFTKNENYFQPINQNGKIIYQSRHQGFVYGPSNTGRSGAIGLGIGNTLEMKVKNDKDTVARKVSILKNLSLSTSYNLMADSFNLAPVAISANTSILDDMFNINVSATLDPYKYEKIINPETNTPIPNQPFERRVDELVWKNGRLGRITNATMALNTNLNPKGRKSDEKSREKITQSNLPEQDKQFLLNNPNAYVDFDIPWSLRINYSMNYNHSINSPIRITQTLQFSGDLSLSEYWKITFNSGYHFETKEFTQTDIGISRDLHCWTMRMNWIPFGRFTSYNFTINVKASVLQDLKLERRKPFFDNL
jgi:hypothetical protein